MAPGRSPHLGPRGGGGLIVPADSLGLIPTWCPGWWAPVSGRSFVAECPLLVAEVTLLQSITPTRAEGVPPGLWLITRQLMGARQCSQHVPINRPIKTR